MTDIHQKKVMSDDHHSTMNVIGAGIAGVVAGGVAVAAAVALSNKDNQKKITDAYDTAKGNVKDYVDTVKAQPVVVESSKKAEEVVKDVKHMVGKKA